MLKIPKFFHEILGEFQTKSSLVVIVIFVLCSGLLTGILGYDEWKELSLIKQIVTWFLFLDISGGVIANLTKGTDLFYNRSSRNRWIFIAIHIQPIILSWSMEISIHYGIIICLYTIISAAFLNLIREHSIHTLLAGSLTGIGLLIAAYYSQEIPFFASTLFIFYIFKVLFSFSVFHHRGEQSDY
ncbi:hypothetical protein [Gracilibacillus kekensis]|uniref:Uncharacterized protein n=1 Tax=Gracilibacillus kekensis TaxID=1027249 RepID=A0A1M7QA92_9BACI|nr:hypothetical protein [Gracilibacillus kekensis]SHN27359.1 hypothetical protein SAMN05216179_2957 [Gracilibacillus kekensis]